MYVTPVVLAPVKSAFVKFEFWKTTPVRFVFLKLTPVKSPLRNAVPASFMPDRLEFVKLPPYTVEPVPTRRLPATSHPDGRAVGVPVMSPLLTPAKFAPAKFAPDRFPDREPLVKFAPVKFAPDRFPDSVSPVKFTPGAVTPVQTVAPSTVEPDRSEPVSVAFVKFAPVRSA